MTLFEILVPASWALFSNLLIDAPGGAEWKHRSRPIWACVGSSQSPFVRFGVKEGRAKLRRWLWLRPGRSWPPGSLGQGNQFCGQTRLLGESCDQQPLLYELVPPSAPRDVILGTLQTCTGIENPLWGEKPTSEKSNSTNRADPALILCVEWLFAAFTASEGEMCLQSTEDKDLCG